VPDVNLLINDAGIALWTDFLVPGNGDQLRWAAPAEPCLCSRASGERWPCHRQSSLCAELGTYNALKAAAWALPDWLRTVLREQGTQVVGVHAGPIDMDMASNFTPPKIKPIDVIRQVLSAVEAGRDEVLANDTTRQVKTYHNFDPEHALQAAR
jgi:NAD(P)-dependent dehydrogenase (short-subunit alcohol dehydrogenase family)